MACFIDKRQWQPVNYLTSSALHLPVALSPILSASPSPKTPKSLKPFFFCTLPTLPPLLRAANQLRRDLLCGARQNPLDSARLTLCPVEQPEPEVLGVTDKRGDEL